MLMAHQEDFIFAVFSEEARGFSVNAQAQLKPAHEPPV